MPFEALIFDVDGTLAETDEIHRAAFNLTFRDTGLNWHWSHAVYARLADQVSARDKVLKFATNYRSEELEALINGGQLEALLARKSRYYVSLVEGGTVPLRPGVCRLIKEVRAAGAKLALCSLGPVANFEVMLQNHFGLGALDLFDVVTTAETLAGTADLDLAYRHTVATLRVDPMNTFAIDDSDAGTAAANRAGLNVIATPGLYTSSNRFATADLVISDLGHPVAPFQVIRGDAGPYNFVCADALSAWSLRFAAAA